MATTYDLRLPLEVDMRLSKPSSKSLFSYHLRGAGMDGRSSLQRTIQLVYSNDKRLISNVINLMVGTGVVLRKSLTGVRIIKDDPGPDRHISLTKLLPEMIQNAEYEKAAFSDIRQSNLCQEISLSGMDSRIFGADYDGDVLGGIPHRDGFLRRMLAPRDAAGERARGEAVHDSVTEYINETRSRELLQDMIYGRGSSIGTVTGRTSGPSRRADSIFRDFQLGAALVSQDLVVSPQASGHRDFSEMMLEMYSTSTRNRYYQRIGVRDQGREYIAPTPAPQGYIDNSNGDVQQINLSDAVRASAEIVEGTRSAPPRSRGPRPRGQRW